MAPLSLALHATCDLCTQRIGEERETLKNIGVQSPKKRAQGDIWKLHPIHSDRKSSKNRDIILRLGSSENISDYIFWGQIRNLLSLDI